MKTVLVWILSLAAVAVAGAAPAASPPGLRAGAATSNITPPLGSAIIGGFAPFPSRHVHDELHARCLVLDDGRTKVALVVCDLLGLHRSVSVEARRLIEEATGIPSTHVMISATHTHSAASAMAGRYVADQPLDEYQRFVARRIADGVHRAANLLRPAQVAFGTVEAPEYPKNRRWVMREGSKSLVNPFGKIDRVKMNPPVASPDLVEPAGPIDPTLSFIALREPGGNPISVYAAYSLHYMGGVGPGHISADYYGVFSEALKKLQKVSEDSPPFVGMLANATSGDIGRVDRRTAQPAKPHYQDMREVGNALARKVNTALASVRWEDRAELGARFQELPIRWRPIDEELLKWAKDVEAKAPRLASGNIPAGASWPTTPEYVVPLAYAGRVQALANAKHPNKVPVQVLRIGDICIGSLPCEVFAEIGLEFKRRSPFAKSFMVELNHGYIGYLPTPRHFELGGYETWPGTNYLEPQASVMMLDALIAMASELHRGAR